MNEYKNKIIHGDALSGLAKLPDNSVHCAVTSPPYWNLRDYGDSNQLGLEETPELYIERLCDILDEVKRVLRDDGTLWLNIGDTYATAKHGNDDPFHKPVNTKTFIKRTPKNCKPKDLIGIPWKAALKCRDRGWYLRRDVIWQKPNAFPESVKDRPVTSHEYIFMLTKSKKYYYDFLAVREKTHNLRSVWSCNIANFSKAHFATFPEDLIRPCIKASTSEHGVCVECGTQAIREYEHTEEFKKWRGKGYSTYNATVEEPLNHGRRSVKPLRTTDLYRTTGWNIPCGHDSGLEPAIVLDMFMGAGTTGCVAKNLGRNYVGTEINEDYIKIANERLCQYELFN